MSESLQVNIEALHHVGNFLRQRRLVLRYSQKDLSSLSGLTTNTISAIENGKGTSLDHFITICRSLQIQPREVFSTDLDLVPLFALPPQVQKRSDISARLKNLIYDTDFFKHPRRVYEVLDELELDRSNSNRFSVYLTGYCQEDVLEYTKLGKVKRYKKKL